MIAPRYREAIDADEVRRFDKCCRPNDLTGLMAE
jgi:hypothetical protein